MRNRIDVWIYIAITGYAELGGADVLVGPGVYRCANYYVRHCQRGAIRNQALTELAWVAAISHLPAICI